MVQCDGLAQDHLDLISCVNFRGLAVKHDVILAPDAINHYSPVANIGDTWCSEERTHKLGSFLYFVELSFDLF